MSDRGADGYRRTPGEGPALRTDIAEVYVFQSTRTWGAGLLQLRRATPPMVGDWRPLMGHIEPGESAVGCATRELFEEVGLRAGDPAWQGMWQLEQVHPYYLAAVESIVLSPCFAVRVAHGWTPTLNHEHDAHRWVGQGAIDGSFVWPGQRAAARETLGVIAPGGEAAERLRLA